MVKSMTGFGMATVDSHNISFQVEIKTVNHRYCDFNIRMPKSFMPIEDRVRKLVLDRIKRGKIDLFITQKDYGNTKSKAVLDENLADSYVECLNKIKDRYNIKEDLSIGLIAKFPDVIVLKQEDSDLDEVWNVLKTAITEAVDDLISMREKEGLKLKNNIICKCDSIKKHVDAINGKAAGLVEEYRSKLNERLKVLLGNCDVDENRVSMEIAMFADKSCIDEEIVRLGSHIIQFKCTLELNEPIGRKLDFILQEMNREANTIASKSTNLEITKLVLNIKNEIEKIREQIQNIE